MSYDSKTGSIEGVACRIMRETIRQDERRWVLVHVLVDGVADLRVVADLRDQYRSEPYVTSSVLWVPKDRVCLDD